MTTPLRRLRKLEEEAAVARLSSRVGVLRERRRRRAKAAGVAYVEPTRAHIDPAPFANGMWLSWEEVLRAYRVRRCIPIPARQMGSSAGRSR